MSSGDHLGSSDDSSPRSFAQSPERILLGPPKSLPSLSFKMFYGPEKGSIPGIQNAKKLASRDHLRASYLLLLFKKRRGESEDLHALRPEASAD